MVCARTLRDVVLLSYFSIMCCLFIQQLKSSFAVSLSVTQTEDIVILPG